MARLVGRVAPLVGARSPRRGEKALQARGIQGHPHGSWVVSLGGAAQRLPQVFQIGAFPERFAVAPHARVAVEHGSKPGRPTMGFG